MLDTIINFADRIVVTITPSLNKVVAALIIIFIGFTIGKFISSFLLKILQDVQVDQTGRRFFKRKIAFAKPLSLIVAYFFYIGSLFMALNTVGITSFVAGAVIIVFAIILLFSILIAMKDFIPNVIAGIHMRKQKRYELGKVLRYKGVKGVIEKRTAIQINVRTNSGELFILPNKLFKKRI